MSRTNAGKSHFANWLGGYASRFQGPDTKRADVPCEEHPLAVYFRVYKTVHGQQMDYALIGKDKWTAVQERADGLFRQCRRLNQWQKDFCRKFDQCGGEGVVTWGEAHGLALGTLMSKQRRGRRTTVQLMLPLIWKRQTRTTVPRSTPTTIS